MRVFVTIFEHKHGRDVSVWATERQAEAERQRIADEWWEEELAGAEKPDDPAEAANQYFELVDEYFAVEACAVTGEIP